MIVHVTIAGFTEAMLLAATWGTVGWYPRGRVRWRLTCGSWCGRPAADKGNRG